MTDVPPGLEAVIREAAPLTARFRAGGHRLFFVGGVVRDHLLDRVRGESDLDATTDARPPEIRALVADLADAVWTQGERFGTIGCVVDGQIYEITTFRAESYADDSRKPVVSFGDHIDDDLARRDFTVNAMAIDLATGELVDPHGGRADLASGVLRTPLDPTISFSEDPLRMLRAARFCAGYGLEPTAELTDAITALLDRIGIVSVERIRDELQKLLLLDDPAPGFALLARTGLLGRVLAPLAELSVEAAVAVAAEVSHVAPDAAPRWAALLVPYIHGVAELRDLKFSGAMTRDIVWFSSAADWVRTPRDRSDRPTIRREAAMVPRERELTELLDWVAALRTAKGLAGDDVEAYRESLGALAATEPDLADPRPLLTGEAVCALLGIDPGPEVGAAMKWLHELRIEEGPLDPTAAANRLSEWWPQRPVDD